MAEWCVYKKERDAALMSSVAGQFSLALRSLKGSVNVERGRAVRAGSRALEKAWCER
jgi:hypothetical protein